MHVELTEETTADTRSSRGAVASSSTPASALALAHSLAHDPRYDLHALIELVEVGCPPELAVRILAPLEGSAA